MKTRIALVDDHRLVRQTLRALLEKEEDFSVGGEAEDGLKAIRICQKIQPDIVLLDLSMPKFNGISAVKEIRRVSPLTKILVLTAHDSEETVLDAFSAGVNGYILKTTGYNELLKAVGCVLKAETYIDPDVTSNLLRGYLTVSKDTDSISAWDSVTLREKQFLRLLATEHTTAEVAELLCISTWTLKKHCRAIMEKLNLHSMAEASDYAMKKGLATIPDSCIE